MTTAHVMVILTLLGDGRLSAAFVNTESKQNCERRAVVVSTILAANNADIQLIRCIPSDLRFDRYSHESAAAAPSHAYLLTLGNASLEVVPMSDLQVCAKLHDDRRSRPGLVRHCVSSSQRLEKPDPQKGVAH